MGFAVYSTTGCACSYQALAVQSRLIGHCDGILKAGDHGSWIPAEYVCSPLDAPGAYHFSIADHKSEGKIDGSQMILVTSTSIAECNEPWCSPYAFAFLAPGSTCRTLGLECNH